MLCLTRREPYHADEATPCDDCRHAARCRTEQLACDRLALYAADASPVRWTLAPCCPSRARFEIIEAALIGKAGERRTAEIAGPMLGLRRNRSGHAFAALLARQRAGRC